MRTRSGLAIAVAVVVVALVAAWASGAAGSSLVSTAGAGGRVAIGSDGSAIGPGLSISEALATSAHGPLFVRGFLVAHGDRVQLCAALTRSLPPQCAGHALAVAGLDPERRGTLEVAGDVRWSASEITLLGDVAGDTLTVYGAGSA